MKTFRQLINELFDHPLPWTWNKKTGTTWRAQFITPNQITYEVNFNFWTRNRDKPDEARYCELVFIAEGSEITKPFGVTGTGNSIAVFSTVVAIVKDFMAHNQDWSFIDFTAGDPPSRKKLYDQFAEFMLRELPSQFSIVKYDPGYNQNGYRIMNKNYKLR